MTSFNVTTDFCAADASVYEIEAFVVQADPGEHDIMDVRARLMEEPGEARIDWAHPEDMDDLSDQLDEIHDRVTEWWSDNGSGRRQF